MTQYSVKIDAIDHMLLRAMQGDAGLSQRALADQVGLSQNACHRRLQKLTEAGILTGSGARINAAALGLSLKVFVMIRTRHHDTNWSDRFRRRAESIPEIVEMHRVGGEWDYLLKVVCEGIAGYDKVYQALIADLDFEVVTGVFSMETMFENRPLPMPSGG